MRVILDTNILCADYQLSGNAFHVLFEKIRQVGGALYFPKIVFEEVQNKYNEELKSWTAKINSSFEKLKRIVGPNAFLPISADRICELVTKYRGNLENKIITYGIVISDYPTTPHTSLIKRALERKKPFSESGTGYRDALIWETVIGISKGNTEEIIFITNNTKDFCDDAKKLHPDLLRDLAANNIDSRRFKIFITLSEFIDVYIKPTLEVLDNIRTAVSMGQYEGLNLQAELPGLSNKFGIGTEWDPREIGLPHEFSNPILVAVDNIKNIRVNSVRKLSAEELLIEIEAQGECSFDFFIDKHDAYVLGEDEDYSVWDGDWNEWVMFAGTLKMTLMNIEIIFNRLSEEVLSLKIPSLTTKLSDDSVREFRERST